MDDQANTIDLELFKQNWQTYKMSNGLENFPQKSVE
jgi:hypothetical protein